MCARVRLEIEQEAVFRRIPENPEAAAERPLGDVSVFDLINAFNKVLKRIDERKEDLREIFEENFTVADKIDLILIMSVNPGFGGQSFISEALKKVRAVRQMIDASGRDIMLEVDGGISSETIKECCDAGATAFVAATITVLG